MNHKIPYYINIAFIKKQIDILKNRSWEEYREDHQKKPHALPRLITKEITKITPKIFQYINKFTNYQDRGIITRTITQEIRTNYYKWIYNIPGHHNGYCMKCSSTDDDSEDIQLVVKETLKHIILECKKYEEERKTMFEEIAKHEERFKEGIIQNDITNIWFPFNKEYLSKHGTTNIWKCYIKFIKQINHPAFKFKYY